MSILPPDVAERLRGSNPAANASEAAQRREADKRAKDAERKRRERKEKKEAAAVRESMSKAEGIEQYWAESLKLADQQKLVTWKALQEAVESQLGAMRDCMEGRAYDDQFIEDVDADTKAMLKELGECGVTPILLSEKFWQNPDLLLKLTSGDTPSALFAKFGVLVALPDLKVHQWGEFMQSRRPSQSIPTTVFYTQIRCSQCSAPPTAVSKETARSYGDKYLCLNCTEKRSKARDFAKGHTLDENTLTDKWGRLKTS